MCLPHLISRDCRQHVQNYLNRNKLSGLFPAWFHVFSCCVVAYVLMGTRAFRVIVCVFKGIYEVVCNCHQQVSDAFDRVFFSNFIDIIMCRHCHDQINDEVIISPNAEGRRYALTHVYIT